MYKCCCVIKSSRKKVLSLRQRVVTSAMVRVSRRKGGVRRSRERWASVCWLTWEIAGGAFGRTSTFGLLLGDVICFDRFNTGFR